MAKLKKTALSIISISLAACFSTSIAAMAMADAKKGSVPSAVAKADPISRIDTPINTHMEDFFDSNVVHRLSDNVKSNQQISVIVSLNSKSTFDAYLEGGSKGEFSDYLKTSAAKSLARKNQTAVDALIKEIDKAQISYKIGVGYDALISGFEVTLRAQDYYKLADAVGKKAQLIVGDEYAAAKTEIVTNDVDVYETGIFDSSDIEHQGDGVVVAVLDTGLDYTHTAFSPDTFKKIADESKFAFTLSTVRDKINNNSLSAATTTANLKAEDVYVNEKVPFAYDYADQDTDVFPLQSEHGTHVAGVIAGHDSEITGVAPNAQLAIMKTFSDREEYARTAWILAALDDCVKLGVDVINVSLGTAAGFTTQDDEERIESVYNKVREAGISLIAAAGNEYVATFNSTKNGNNPLTRNPDSGIVGSPSTYESALSVASVGGVKTPYFIYNDDVIYFTEATTSEAKTKHFVDDVLNAVGAQESYDFTYVTIPGVGRISDYAEEPSYYRNKIVLVKRGDTMFEEKVDVALRRMGAAGIIIYNNVSGSINMSVGKDIGAVCSISQDEGEKLAAAKTGILHISKSQVAGPFMSDFSSWGPTSDLKIKPEITAHGGEIYSAVPGQAYDRMSGTSMASPNMAGAAALIRQYVKYGNEASGKVFGDPNEVEVTKLVNQLAMSTADIVYNQNGLPYAVRKQGAGLVNIKKATTAAAYISTYYEDGTEMDKTKLELGDDKYRTGVYTMTFGINNLSKSAMTYDLASLIITEGVSSTFTSHGDTTVTQDGYLLHPTTEITKVTGGTNSGSKVTVPAGGVTQVTVKIKLSDADKKYIDDSFQYGMYVEGFITLTAVSGTSIDLNVPLLAFYGDWTEAPIFDEEYYDTNPDELNSGIDEQDKIMADAFATLIYGGFYSDYISILGAYAFIQDPAATQIAANKEHIALSNYEDGDASSLNSIYSIAGGVLRNVKQWTLSIVEDSTGKEVWSMQKINQRKSFNNGSMIYGANMDVDFYPSECNLKNNTKYTATVTAYIDYGNFEDQNNVRNTFVFPLYIDFEAPIITDVEYRTEYDQSTKKTHLYADMSIYDNHYAMAVQFGQIVYSGESGSPFAMDSFGKYITPVYSSFNSTSKVTFELTDYIPKIKQSVSVTYDEAGDAYLMQNTNRFIVTCYDYALNYATYELEVPDEVIAMYFEGEEIQLNPNETLDLTSVLHIFPAETWAQILDFSSSNPQIVGVVNQTAIAKFAGMGQSAVITAKGKDANGYDVSAQIKITVRKPGDNGYKVYDPPQVNKAEITQYYTDFAFHGNATEEKEIGDTGRTYYFGNSNSLSMYPAEMVTLLCSVDSYFTDAEAPITLKFSSSNSTIATVDENGMITALAKGSVTISVRAEITYKFTYPEQTTSFFIGTVSVTVKDPFENSGTYLTAYKGLGGTVEIPGNRGITTIQSFAFSLYDIVEKDLEAGDIIDIDDPNMVKQVYFGDMRPEGKKITKVIIPEGVTTINAYAFANLYDLEEVVLPSTLIRIGLGAFYNCQKLTKVNLEYAKFINESAFYNCSIAETNFASVVAIGSNAFYNNAIVELKLPASAQSIDSGAFRGNTGLNTVTFDAPQIKIGEGVFYECSEIASININATIIPAYAFYGCSKLSDVTLGKDVAIIGESAFAGTRVSSFKVDGGNNYIVAKDFNGSAVSNGPLLYDKSTDKEQLLMVAPQYESTTLVIPAGTKTIARGAFASNTTIEHVSGDDVEILEAYAFADCSNLQDVNFPALKEIGDYAFFNCVNLKEVPDLTNVKTIGAYAFAGNPVVFGTVVIGGEMKLTSVNIPNGVVIGEGAFAACFNLQSVTIGDNVVIGTGAFYNAIKPMDYSTGNELLDLYYEAYYYTVDGTDFSATYYKYKFEENVLTSLTELTIGSGVTIGANAFANSIKLQSVTLGENATVGASAFYNAISLTSINFENILTIGEAAFSGGREYDLWVYSGQIMEAFKYENVDGEAVATGYIYNDYVPQFTEVDLSNVTFFDVGAFAFSKTLTSVTLNSNLEIIPDYAFAECFELTSVKVIGSETNELPASVTKIGDYAFISTQVNGLNLANLDVIGAYAFAATPLSEVTLKDGVQLGEYAFYNCEELTTVNNMGGVNTIGASAFVNTAITEADLTNVELVGDFAFGGSQVKTVVFGDKLETIGENPFYGCPIESFARTEDETFNGSVVGTIVTDTYDITDTVKVIDNVLYTVVPNGGLQLVAYPIGAKATTFTVQEGTVRVGARAFMGAQLVTVTLPQSLKALGDKAFYGCEKLTSVVFKSYNAPILEEECDMYYQSGENLPLKGQYGMYEGLGIAGFYMWNPNQTNFYYGANFVDYIGKTAPSLIMVRPANGVGYDTFIFGKYFNTFVNGSNAPMDATLRVIALIAALNSDITLADEAAVAAARAAYDALPNLEQKALVENYSKLTNAERTIEYLKSRDVQPGNTDTEAVGSVNSLAIAGFTVAGVLAIALAALAVYTLLNKKKARASVAGGELDSGETVNSESEKEEVAPSEDDNKEND